MEQMFRMEQLGYWLVVEKLFWQVTDSIHAFLLSVERLSISFTSNNLFPFQYDLGVKKMLYATSYGGRKHTTTETYTSHLFRCDKKSEFILIARFTLPLASWMLKLPKIVSTIPPPLIHLSLHTHTHTPLSPLFTSHFTPTPTRPYPPYSSLTSHPRPNAPVPLFTSHFIPTPTLSFPH